MSRKLLRTVLAACMLAGLLAGPARAADFGPLSVTEGLWRWLIGMWQTISWTIDPDGSNAAMDISMGTDPNGDGLASSGNEEEKEIGMEIDPNG